MASGISRRVVTAGAAMASIVAAVGDGGPMRAVAAGVVVAAVGVTVVGEVFWLRALGQPLRQLRWVRRHAPSPAEAEQWMTALGEARREVLRARERQD